MNETDLCANPTTYDRFRAWFAAGVFLKLWQLGVERLDELKGIDRVWLSMDGAMTKTSLGVPDPTDRGKGMASPSE